MIPRVQTTDVGDNTVTYTHDGETYVILTIVPHFEGADPVTAEECVESIEDQRADYLRDVRGAR